MAIEVRQVIVNSIVSAPGDQDSPSVRRREADKLKDQILPECRRIVLELLRAERER